MSQFLIPVPLTAIGTVDANGRVIMGREWYRYFTLIQQALGGSTDIIGDFDIQSQPVEQVLAETMALLVGAIIDASGQAIAARAAAEDLARRVSDLEMQARGREEIPFQAIADLQIMMPGPPS